MAASTSPAWRHLRDGLKDPLRVALALPFGSGNGRDPHPLAVDQCLAAFEMVYQDNAGAVEMTDFYGRDETVAHLSFACAEMLSARTAGNAKRVAAFTHLLAINETSRSLIEIALEVGYTSPSHFAQEFRRTVGMAPTQFRNAL
jgi:AraC-like DNA-binding protein